MKKLILGWHQDGMQIPQKVTTKKNIIPIINGDIIFPKNIPKLNQSLFNGVKSLEFINPKIKKIKDIIKDHILKSLLLNKGQIAIIIKTIKNTIPKFLFVGILIFLLRIVN